MARHFLLTPLPCRRDKYDHWSSLDKRPSAENTRQPVKDYALRKTEGAYARPLVTLLASGYGSVEIIQSLTGKKQKK
jgi:hypothetical protein